VLPFCACAIWIGRSLTIALGRKVFSLDAALTLHAIIAPTLAVHRFAVLLQTFQVTGPSVSVEIFVAFIIIFVRRSRPRSWRRSMRCSRAFWVRGFRFVDLFSNVLHASLD
jgi:hypothetical protein